MAHEIGAVDRLRTLLRPTPPARARQYGPAAATAGAALDGLGLPATMILLLAAGPARAVFTTGTTDLDAFAAATADRYATLGKALFSLCAYDAVRENLRRHGAPAVGITTDFRFVLALLGHPAR